MVSRCLSNQFKQMEYQMDSVEEDSDVMPIQPGAPKKNVQFDTPLTSTRDITPRATPADSLDAEIPNEPESSVSNDTATHKRRNQIVDELPAKARHPISIQECVLRGEEYLKGYAVKSDRITRAIADIQKATMDLGLKMRPVVEGLVEYQKKLYDVMVTFLMVIV
uniref:Uncharacterized protein n=1 Tax=Panagrolaimus sp. JU765 TaxID=591449 RepID=A0AC34R104_9BILA